MIFPAFNIDPPEFPQKGDELALFHALQEFNNKFPTEEDSIEEIKTRLQKESLLECHYCRSNHMENKYGARVLKCLDCNQKTWFTSGTFFHRTKRLRAMLATIWLMEHGLTISSSKLHKLTNVAQSSAFNFLKRIATVLEDYMQTEVCEIPSSDFYDIFCKRSKETPKRKHPKAEQEEVDALLQEEEQQQFNNNELTSFSEKDLAQPNTNTGQTGENKQGNENDNDQLSPEEKAIYNLLSDIPISFEELYLRSQQGVPQLSATLVILEIAGLVTRLPGEHYIRFQNKSSEYPAHSQAQDTSTPYLSTGSDIAIAAINFMRENFHGISRKYLQKYVAIYWFHKNQGNWPLNALLDACLKFRHVKLAEITGYVTPPFIKYLSGTPS